MSIMKLVYTIQSIWHSNHTQIDRSSMDLNYLLGATPLRFEMSRDQNQTQVVYVGSKHVDHDCDSVFTSEMDR